MGISKSQFYFMNNSLITYIKEKYLQYILKVETVNEGLVFKSHVVITMK